MGVIIFFIIIIILWKGLPHALSAMGFFNKIANIGCSVICGAIVYMMIIFGCVIVCI